MKRELWVIGKTVASAIGILNSVRCEAEENPLSRDDQSLIVELVNSECSGMMLDSIFDLVNDACDRPTGRLCERTDCDYYKRGNANLLVSEHNIKCKECTNNQKSDTADMYHFEDNIDK